MKKQRDLGKRVVSWCIFLAVILILVLSIVVGAGYFKLRMKQYSDLAFSYTRAAAQFIDGDRVLGYLESGEPDDYFQEVLDYLQSFLDQSELEYYYVFVPEEDELVYVWDSDTSLGYHEDYFKGGKEITESIFRENPPEKIALADTDDYGYLASAFSPVFDSSGKPVAVVGVDLLYEQISKDILKFILIIVLCVLAVITPAVIVIYQKIKKGIVKPIQTLNSAAECLVERIDSDQVFKADIHTGDEIESLANSFEKMDAELKTYITELSAVTAERERISTELNVATQIQASMLPRVYPAFPEYSEFEIYASMDPAKEVGGDFYDFFMVDDRHLAVIVADVSGKGVPAALFMVIAKTLIKDHTNPGLDLSEVFTKVNTLLCESNSEGMFVTAFEGVLDLDSGEFIFVNAGHETPFICKKGQKYEPYKIRNGFVLAGLNGIKYKSGAVMLDPGDKLFQYTDGVTEATNSNQQLYGMNRLEKVLGDHSELSPTDLLPEVKADIDRFVGEAPQFDDITMLCLEYKGKEENIA